MNYFEWKLDDDEEIEPETPLGTLTLHGEVGRISDDNLMLDSFLGALIEGLARIRDRDDVRIDTIDEPAELVLRRVPGGVELRFGDQKTVIQNEVKLRDELVGVVSEFLAQLDAAARKRRQEPVGYAELRDFLAGAPLPLLVVPDLELPWKQYEAFRDGVREDARRNNDWRIDNAGFAWELRSDEQAAESWNELLRDRADEVGLYVVTTAQQQIVGMLKLRKLSEKAVCYSQVLYRRREHRGGVDPVRVYQVLEERLRASGIDEMTTGKIEGGDAARSHLEACGFELFSNAGGEFGRKVLTAANPPESR